MPGLYTLQVTQDDDLLKALEPRSGEVRADHRISVLFLTALTALFCYAVLFLSAPVAQTNRQGRESRNLYLLALGILGFAYSVYSIRRRGRQSVSLSALLPCYAAFQLVPLPLSVLRAVSPARAELLQALAPLGLQPSFAPISVAPSLTLTHLLLISGYAMVFFLVSEIARGSRDRPWQAALPIIAIGAWQGSWGVSQFLSRGALPFAHGTYPIRNHFAGLLEMSLPFAVAYGGASLRKAGWRGPLSATAAFRAGAGFAAAALIGAGILFSLSRGGFVACAVSMFVMGTLALFFRFRGKKKWSMLVVLSLLVAVVLAFSAPVQLANRFSNISEEGRTDVWRSTLPLIGAYPLFGTGLGGYAAAFEKFQTSQFALVQDYAHNDYLQYLAEMGIVGFLIAAVFLLRLTKRAVRASLYPSDSATHWLGLACSGALAAILTHSAADFNLYVPANATLLAWICGIAAGSLVELPRRSLDSRQ